MTVRLKLWMTGHNISPARRYQFSEETEISCVVLLYSCLEIFKGAVLRLRNDFLKKVSKVVFYGENKILWKSCDHSQQSTDARHSYLTKKVNYFWRVASAWVIRLRPSASAGLRGRRHKYYIYKDKRNKKYHFKLNKLCHWNDTIIVYKQYFNEVVLPQGSAL
jgi:hypothetical protein